MGFLVSLATGVSGAPSREGQGQIEPEPSSSSKSGNLNNGAPFVSRNSSESVWIPIRDWVANQEALPCTGPQDPINFEVFSAGAAPAGLSLNSTVRRCTPGAVSDESPANFVAYTYGHCEIAEGATGCTPPLQVHTWPACQRALSDYSFEGKPLPYKVLGRPNGAEVVEIDFMIDRRIEIYTGDSTVVIFAEDPNLALKAVDLLRSQKKGERIAEDEDALESTPAAQLGPPARGAMEGELPCQT